MNIEKIDSLELDELISLRNEIRNICEEYTKTLSTYATVSNDPHFQKMESNMEKSYERRNEFARSLGVLNFKIEEKIYNEYIKD